MQKETKNSPFRLPAHIRPTEYHLYLEPELGAQTFAGTVTIQVAIGKKSDTLFLHAKSLTIGQIFLRQDKTGITPKVTYRKKSDTIELQLPKKISGNWEIHISYTGIIHTDMRGFYLSTYTHNGKEERIGTTQFEAIDARRALPCFDEPDMKAAFNLRLAVPKELSALSNTEIVSTAALAGGKIEYVFAQTPVMSTYLLAWTIGRFEKVSASAKNGSLVSVYAPLGKKHLTGFALDTAIRSLDWYEKYFTIPYPLKKMDLVAIPDFAAGAMENWGLITFRETCLLVDKKNTAISNMQWIALVVAHEIAHQWFGNLVTMKWWDDLWLNEGFANYIEYQCIDSIFPEWKVWEDFTHSDMGDALRLDALKSSHPIEVPIKDAHDIDEIFDDITYRKGASVIRMLAEYMGAKDFQKGISAYLKQYAYGNATTKDLWRYLENASGKPVSKVMGAWTRQAGFPIVRVEEKPGALKCRQCRYYRNRTVGMQTEDKTLWPIPLSDGKKTYLTPQKQTFDLTVSKDARTLNSSESTLVHIAYPESFLTRQKEALRMGKLTVLERMGLLRNVRALAENGQYSTEAILEFFELYKNEAHHLVLAELWGAMLRVEHFFGIAPELTSKLRTRYAQILNGIWSLFSWNSKERDDKMRDATILSMALHLGHQDTIHAAIERFRKGKQALPTHLRAGTYRIAVRYGNKSDRQMLHAMLTAEKLHEERVRLMASLAAVEKEADVTEVLNFYVSPAVKPQDTPILIARLLADTPHPELVYRFIVERYGMFLERYGNGGHLLSRILGSLSVIRSQAVLKEMKQFFKKYPAPGCAMTLAQVYERIEGTLAWQKADMKSLRAYLEKYEKNS